MGFLLNVLKTIFRPAVKASFEKIKRENPDLGKETDPLEYLSQDMKDMIEREKEKAKNGDEGAISFLKGAGVPLPEGTPEVKTSDEAIEELEKAKKKLDLELISQEEYDRIKEDLKQFIN